MITYNPIFGIGQRIYHATRDGDEGIVINISHNLRDNSIKYEVVFGRTEGDQVWCYEEELSDIKIF